MTPLLPNGLGGSQNYEY